MNHRLFAASAIFLLAVAAGTYWPPGDRASGRATSAEETTTGRQILATARDLLDALGEKERAKARFEFGDAERFNWHFIPRERKGLSLKELDESKRQRVARLLETSLSATGYEKAEQVRELEGILRDIEGSSRRFSRDPLEYFVSFFGTPSKETKWGWRFEGHHLALNFTLEASTLLSSTPSFYGANPATVKEGPKKGLRVLAGVEDLARELVTSLDEEQLAACLGKGGGEDADKVPNEVPETERPRYKGPFPPGVAAKELTKEQKKKLRRLIREYRNNFPADVSKGVNKGIREAGFGRVRIAWSGGLKPSEPHSYIVHGPTFVINYSNRQGGANHVHACFRELKKDFALASK